MLINDYSCVICEQNHLKKSEFIVSSLIKFALQFIFFSSFVSKSIVFLLFIMKGKMRRLEFFLNSDSMFFKVIFVPPKNLLFFPKTFPFEKKSNKKNFFLFLRTKCPCWEIFSCTCKKFTYFGHDAHMSLILRIEFNKKISQKKNHGIRSRNAKYSLTVNLNWYELLNC